VLLSVLFRWVNYLCLYPCSLDRFTQLFSRVLKSEMRSYMYANASTAEYIKTDLSLPLESPLTDVISRNIGNEGSRLVCEIREICGFLHSLRPLPIIIIAVFRLLYCYSQLVQSLVQNIQLTPYSWLATVQRKS
jgi:hypothetical protein